MQPSTAVVLCFALPALAPAGAAQSFSYPTFANLGGLALNGSAAGSGSNLRVTNLGPAQTGSVWHGTPVPVAGGFDTRFDFVLSATTEGLAFVVHGAPSGATTLGGNLWGMGYGFGATSNPIPQSLAIEIDAIQSVFLNDTSSNELSVHTVGVLGNSENEGVSIGRVNPVFDMSNGAVHTMRVTYQPGTLEIYVDNLGTPLLSVPFTFENGGQQLTGGATGGLGLPTGDAWVGFTASTSAGATTQYAELRTWSWTSFQPPHPCYVGNVLAGSGGPYDLLRINGGNGGFYRQVGLALADPFTLSLAPPPTEASAPFVLFATLGRADATTVTTTPWGLACFPPGNVVDLGSFLAPHALAVPPGIAIPVPLTLQAVMATNSQNPAVLELTNAIGLEFTLAPPPAITSVAPNSAPVGGTITVAGSNFSLHATVDLNGVPVPLLAVSKQQITFAMPASVPCAATLRVRNPDGAAATRPFNPVPVITSQVNTSGPAAGGTTYVAIGSGFALGTTVTIGGVPATVSSASASAIVCLTPPRPPGPALIVITTPGGCSVTSTFTYL